MSKNILEFFRRQLFRATTPAPPLPQAPLRSEQDLRKILVERIDTQKRGVGIVVGMTGPRGRRMINYGHLAKGDSREADGDTVFEIGSATKVFTSLLLADMAQRGELSLNDPVAKYLPSGVCVPQRNGHFIALLDLATHTSGLPRLPGNLALRNRGNPYADYSVQQLYDFLSRYKLPRDIGSQYEYSNLGGGLLGHALALRAGRDYESLVCNRICDVLGLESTRISLTPELHARFATGHNAALRPVPNWDLPTLAGAGALRSTANDLLTLLDAFLERTSSRLAPAMTAMRTVRRPTGHPNLEMAIGWHILTGGGQEIFWHNGGTGGYRSFLGFHLQRRIGVVVLSNTFTAAGVDDIGSHLLRWQIVHALFE